MFSCTILSLLVGGVSGLKVIGAGPGRSGTDSMKQALIDLGFGKRPLLPAPCIPAFRATESDEQRV